MTIVVSHYLLTGTKYLRDLRKSEELHVRSKLISSLGRLGCVYLYQPHAKLPTGFCSFSSIVFWLSRRLEVLNERTQGTRL